jgi:hypothetical protein
MIPISFVLGMNSAATGAAAAAPPMEKLMVCGFLLMVLTLLFYGYQKVGPVCVLGLGICLGGMAAYGFALGAWPVGILLTVLAAHTLVNWWREKRFGGWVKRKFRRPRAPMPVWHNTSRITRLYGSIKSGGNFN